MKKIPGNCDDTSLSVDDNLLISGKVKLPISEKEKKLLDYFIEHPEIEISKRKLIEYIWQDRAETIDDANLTQLIYKVRRSLAAVSLTECIKTVPGKGYKFIPIPPAGPYAETPSPMNSPEKNARKWKLSIGIALIVITFIMIICLLFWQVIVST